MPCFGPGHYGMLRNAESRQKQLEIHTANHWARFALLDLLEMLTPR